MTFACLKWGAAAAIVMLSGCGGLNAVLAERRESVEMYYIFDVKTKLSSAQIGQSTVDGLARNTGSVVQNKPLMLGGRLPEKAGRFQLVDMSAQLGGLGQLAMMGGTTLMRIAKCDNASWTGKATRNITGSDVLQLYACLYPYREGYHLNVYATFSKVSGGAMGIPRDIAHSIVGTPEQWVAKTINDMVSSIETTTRSKVVLLEGQPELASLPAIVGAR